MTQVIATHAWCVWLTLWLQQHLRQMLQLPTGANRVWKRLSCVAPDLMPGEYSEVNPLQSALQEVHVPLIL